MRRWLIGVCLLLLAAGGLPAQGQEGEAVLPPALAEVEAALTQLRGINPADSLRYERVTSGDMLSLLSPPSFSEAEMLLAYALNLSPANSEASAFVTLPPVDAYDPAQGTLFITGDLPQAGPLRVLDYSYTYALALLHQHFEPALPSEAFLSDADLALLALWRGDALFTMQQQLQAALAEDPSLHDILLRASLSSPAPNLPPDFPAWAQAEHAFTMRQGAAFVAAIYEAQGWAGVNALYEQPPTTSEQLLHPDRYLEQAAPLELPLTPLEEGEALLSGTLGEWRLQQHLASSLSPEMARLLAGGWNGDSFLLYAAPEGAFTLLWRIAWDTELDAAEFNDNYDRLLEDRLAVVGNPLGERLFCWENPTGMAACMQTGRIESLIIYAPTLAAAQQGLAAQATRPAP